MNILRTPEDHAKVALWGEQPPYNYPALIIGGYEHAGTSYFNYIDIKDVEELEVLKEFVKLFEDKE